MQKKKFAKPKKNHYFCIAFQKAWPDATQAAGIDQVAKTLKSSIPHFILKLSTFITR